MHYLPIRKSWLKAYLFIFICLTAFASSATAGLDYYQIFIGKKLIYERYVNKPLSLQNLPIGAADANQMLTIYYFQCNAPGKIGNNRIILLRDEQNKTIKQWTFSNVQGANTSMVISIKELMQMQKANKNHALALYYTAEGRAEGEKLAFVQAGAKEVTYAPQQNAAFTLLCAKTILRRFFENT